MYQEVNLYQPIFRQERKLFSARKIFVALGVLVAGMAAISAVSGWRLTRLERQLAELQVQEKRQERREQSAGTMLTLGDDRKSTEERLKTLAVELDRRQKALLYLRGPAGSRAGFASRMEALARQQLDGLWITGAIFTDSGGFALSGTAVSAELVPRFLGRLAAEPALAGTRLDDFEMEH